MTSSYHREALITLAIVTFIKKSVGEPVEPVTQQCRSKFGTFNRTDFVLHECSWCYFFLFQFQTKPLAPHPVENHLTVTTNTTSFPIWTKLLPDVKNSTSRQAICSTLRPDECTTWTLCCHAAKICCEQQIESGSQVGNSVRNRTCKSTWDGYGCWKDGTASTNSHIECPSFIKYSIPTRKAVKTCLANGTWFQKGNTEWTDYTPCLKYEELRITIFISVGCQIASLMLLIPSLWIFLHYKSLRRQHRIRLHINFFISFIFSGIFTILWNLLVTYDKLTNSQVIDTLMYQNTGSCKLLSFMKLYFTSTNYTWMFCEGFYLYRLIVNAFSPPKRLLLLYISGWGIPFLYSLAYAFIRVALANESCWAISIGGKEWIMYAPNLMCLVANLFFLCSILRILLTQLQAHPNEPSNFRRALKATFVLIPLFGVQLIVTIYRCPQEMPGAIHYERFSEVISNSQGFVVALIFCFCNGEVASQIKRSWRHVVQEHVSTSRKFNNTLSLNFNNSMSQRTVDHTSSRDNSLDPCLRPLSQDTSASTLHSQI